MVEAQSLICLGWFPNTHAQTCCCVPRAHHSIDQLVQSLKRRSAKAPGAVASAGKKRTKVSGAEAAAAKKRFLRQKKNIKKKSKKKAAAESGEGAP